MGSVAERHYLHQQRDEFLERGCAVYNTDVDDDAFSCRTDHTTVKASNVQTRRLTGFTGSTVEHESGQGVTQAHQDSLLLQLVFMSRKSFSYLKELLMHTFDGILALMPQLMLMAHGIQAPEAPDAPVASDGIQAPNRQDARTSS